MKKITISPYSIIGTTVGVAVGVAVGIGVFVGTGVGVGIGVAVGTGVGCVVQGEIIKVSQLFASMTLIITAGALLYIAGSTTV